MIVLNMLLGLSFVFMAGTCLALYTEGCEGDLLIGAAVCLLIGVVKVFSVLSKAVEVVTQ